MSILYGVFAGLFAFVATQRILDPYVRSTLDKQRRERQHRMLQHLTQRVLNENQERLDNLPG